jgi:hypothetical protein
VVNSQPVPPALPVKQFYQLGAPVAGLAVFMNSGGSIKGLPTVVVIAGGLVRR